MISNDVNLNSISSSRVTIPNSFTGYNTNNVVNSEINSSKQSEIYRGIQDSISSGDWSDINLDGHKYRLIVTGGEITSNTKFVYALQGSNFGEDFGTATTYLEGTNESIVFLAPYDLDKDSRSDESYAAFQSVMNDQYNIPGTVSMTSFSASGTHALKSMAYIADSNPDNNYSLLVADCGDVNPVYTGLNSGSWNSFDKTFNDLDGESCENLTILSICESGRSKFDKEFVDPFAQLGATHIKVIVNSPNDIHSGNSATGINTIALTESGVLTSDGIDYDKLVEYCSGLGYSVNVSITTYENGELVDKAITDIEEIKKLFAQYNEGNKTDPYLSFKSPTIYEKRSGSDQITLDYNFCVDAINVINTNISKTSYMYGFADTNCYDKSNSAVPAGISSLINSYFDMNNCLISSLSNFGSAVMNCVSSFEDVENKFSDLASNIYTADISGIGLISGATINADGSYNFDLSSLIGSSSNRILTKSDIESILNSGYASGFSQDVEDSSKLLGSLYSFMNDAKNKGDAWNSIVDGTGYYCDLVRLRIQCDIDLSAAITKALNLINDYIGEFEELSEEKYLALKNEKEDLEEQIESLKIEINRTQIVTVDAVYNTEGKLISSEYEVEEPVYSATEKANFIAQIRGYEMQIRQVIDPYLERYEGLDAVMAEAESIINEALNGPVLDYANLLKQANV